MNKKFQEQEIKVDKLKHEVSLREDRLEAFASDTANLQSRVRELLQAVPQSPQRLESLESELVETKRLHHQISLKWKRAVTNSHEIKKELAASKEQLQQLDEYKAAMKVAAIEIEALHRSRDESKSHSEDAANRLRKHFEEAQEENNGLRVEMVKIIAERNLLYQQLTGTAAV